MAPHSARLTVAVIAGLAPRVAEADLLAARAGDAPPRAVQRTLVVVDAGPTQITQETITFQGVSGRFARLFAVPSDPRFPPPIANLESLAAEYTKRRPPFRYIVRDDPLGPSLASRLLDRGSTPVAPDAAAQASEPAPLEVVARSVFEGSATTSTVTKQFILPPALERFATRHQLELPSSVAAAVAKHLNEGNPVVGLVYAPTARATRTTNQRWVAGPLRYDVVSESPVTMVSDVEPDPALEIFTIGAAPLTPASIPTSWSETPWAVRDPATGSATVFGSTRWPTDAAGPPPWVTSGAVSDRSVETITHLRYEPSNEPYRDIRWSAATDPPTRPRRGSASDVWWVIVFGAVPAFAAPESWVLFWLQRRARERATPARVGWATRAWFAWPVVVGVYWLVTMQGLGRWAALLPFAIALFGLRRYEPEHRRFVRARFEKKKSAKS